MNMTYRSNLLIYLQRAVLANITQNMRAVLCKYVNSKIEINFILNTIASNDDIECMGDVETQLYADFDDVKVIVSHEHIEKPGAIKANEDFVFAYKAKE